MNVVLLILAALILPATMVVLSVCMNELEKNTKALGDLLLKRYTIEPKKSTEQADKLAAMIKSKAKT
jgi:hypothetical protein